MAYLATIRSKYSECVLKLFLTNVSKRYLLLLLIARFERRNLLLADTFAKRVGESRTFDPFRTTLAIKLFRPSLPNKLLRPSLSIASCFGHLYLTSCFAHLLL